MSNGVKIQVVNNPAAYAKLTLTAMKPMASGEGNGWSFWVYAAEPDPYGEVPVAIGLALSSDVLPSCYSDSAEPALEFTKIMHKAVRAYTGPIAASGQGCRVLLVPSDPNNINLRPTKCPAGRDEFKNLPFVVVKDTSVLPLIAPDEALDYEDVSHAVLVMFMEMNLSPHVYWSDGDCAIVVMTVDGERCDVSADMTLGFLNAVPKDDIVVPDMSERPDAEIISNTVSTWFDFARENSVSNYYVMSMGSAVGLMMYKIPLKDVLENAQVLSMGIRSVTTSSDITEA